MLTLHCLDHIVSGETWETSELTGICFKLVVTTTDSSSALLYTGASWGWCTVTPHTSHLTPHSSHLWPHWSPPTDTRTTPPPGRRRRWWSWWWRPHHSAGPERLTGVGGVQRSPVQPSRRVGGYTTLHTRWSAGVLLEAGVDTLSVSQGLGHCN